MPVLGARGGQIEERIATIVREQHRIAEHKGELVDTDVWVGGVMQVGAEPSVVETGIWVLGTG